METEYSVWGKPQHTEIQVLSTEKLSLLKKFIKPTI
jgi:hypothetical protein